MAFVCPRQDDMVKKQAALNAIADIALELKKELENVYCESANPPPCCCQCNCPPVNCPSPQTITKPQEAPCEPPNVLVCYKVAKAKPTTTNKKETRKNQGRSNEGQTVIRLKQSKSRELRAGVMYVGCDCEKRNGLQDDCHRTECHGSPECLTRPSPVCGPSAFSNGGSYYGGAAASISGNNQQSRPENVDNCDCLEYEYQCFPATEKADDADGMCCKIDHVKQCMWMGYEGNTSEYRDQYCIPEEDPCSCCSQEWDYVALPARVVNIKQVDNCCCHCNCGPTGRAKYWCQYCNRSLPFRTY